MKFIAVSILYAKDLIMKYRQISSYPEVDMAIEDICNEAICEEHGDSDLVQYMVSDDDEEPDFDEIDSVPESAMFLHDKDEDNYKRPWYESHTEFEHSYGVEWGSAYITVTEVDSMDYSANQIQDIIEGENLSDMLSKLEEESNWEIELTEMGCEDEAPEGTDYIAQLYSSEKGQFFDGVIKTVGEFDIKKLKVYADANHPHVAQDPKPYEIKQIKQIAN